jgi:metallo-beta-lactamase class B
MSKFNGSSLLIFLLLSHALTSFSQKLTPLPYSDSAWSKPYQPFRIAGNLYYVGTYDLACFLIVTPEGHVLINSGLAASATMIKKSVEALGFKFADIKILLTTQAHYDHVAGLAEIKENTGAKMMVHENDAQVLGDGGSSDFSFGGNGSTFAPVKADRLLHDGDTITIGETTLRVLHHPGHTKGATSFLMDAKEEKRSWKVLIVNMPSILTQTRIYGMPSYPNVGRDYKHTLESLKKIEFDLWVASHASQFGLHDKRKEGDGYRPEAFADQAGYEASVNSFLQEYRNRLKSEKKN